jgi:bifunctional UDP-N-acetylglucosamine pyrophosphorylase / glucosamine-1-phosphate N-acetyltransferase
MSSLPQESHQDFYAGTSSCLAVILAAGEGTRMRSLLPKVLHKVAGRSMLGHVLESVRQAGVDTISVVVGPDREDVEKEACGAGAQAFVQRDRLGTAHAVLAARAALNAGPDEVIVACADTPLILSHSLLNLRMALHEGADIAVLGFKAQDPTGYGRLILQDHSLIAIREEREANPIEKSITLCNAGILAFRGKGLLSLLERIGNDNAKREYYLTDAIALACASGLSCRVVVASEDEVRGVNDRIQLAEAEKIMQNRLRERVLSAGVTMSAPETVFLSFDTQIAQDVTLAPYIVIGPDVTIGQGATIHAFSHLEGCQIHEKAQIGPYARLRPGTVIGSEARIGNFVEVKNTILEPGAKASHLTYLGDADIGSDANIGAGTITCNYDGLRKSRTKIGKGAFIGSNSALVAPVQIGKGAYIGSGSVITRNIPDKALALTRASLVIREGWSEKFQDRTQRNEEQQRSKAQKDQP